MIGKIVLGFLVGIASCVGQVVALFGLMALGLGGLVGMVVVVILCFWPVVVTAWFHESTTANIIITPTWLRNLATVACVVGHAPMLCVCWMMWGLFSG